MHEYRTATSDRPRPLPYIHRADYAFLRSPDVFSALDADQAHAVASALQSERYPLSMPQAADELRFRGFDVIPDQIRHHVRKGRLAGWTGDDITDRRDWTTRDIDAMAEILREYGQLGDDGRMCAMLNLDLAQVREEHHRWRVAHPEEDPQSAAIRILPGLKSLGVAALWTMPDIASVQCRSAALA